MSTRMRRLARTLLAALALMPCTDAPEQ